MSSYDRWLEEPYTRAAAEEAAFEKWCEENGVEFDAEDAWDRFEEASREEYEAWADDRAEELAEERMLPPESIW